MAGDMTIPEYAEAQERYRAVASLIKAAGSQLGANGWPVTGSVIFMNAETIAAEISDCAIASPQLALTVDFIVNAAHQLTAGAEPPQRDSWELFADAYR